MNYSPRKLTLWTLAFYLTLAAGIAPVSAKAQATASSPTAAKPAAQATPAAPATPVAPAPGSTASKSAAGKPSSSEITAAKAAGKVWVNTESRVYHKGGRWYGKTKQGKFMTEAEAKAAGYKAAARD
ncbi:MAG: hypothetical protein ACLPZJ_18075 [Terriglobales bacterium]